MILKTCQPGPCQPGGARAVAALEHIEDDGVAAAVAVAVAAAGEEKTEDAGLVEDAENAVDAVDAEDAEDAGDAGLKTGRPAVVVPAGYAGLYYSARLSAFAADAVVGKTAVPFEFVALAVAVAVVVAGSGCDAEE